MSNLNLFVSSTCYDLSQLRATIYRFIKDSGHNPILSEFNSFPVSPQMNAVQNCIKNVKDNADILILVVGSRYGSVIESGKSITNIEFLTAREKGIPIYCFIEKTTLNALKFWKENKNGDFTKFVDNNQIFEFIDDIRTKKNLWVYSFEQSQEIVDTLKIQLSYLFKNSLRIKNILDKDVVEFFKLNLSEKCLKILIERADYYEFEFLYQSLIDEMAKREFLKHDIEYSIFVEPKQFINDVQELIIWGSNRVRSILSITNNLTNLYAGLIKFLNEQGKPADLKGLYYFSVRYSQIFEQVINWMVNIKSTYIIEEFSDLKIHLADMTSKVVEQMWDYPFEIKTKVEYIKEQSLLGNPISSIDLNLTLDINEEAKNSFNKLLKELEEYHS